MNLLTPQEVAKRMKKPDGKSYTEQAIYLAIREGRLNAVMILGRIGITEDEFKRFRKERTNGTKKAA